MPDRQSFKLGEIGKIPNPDASDRLAVFVADKMRGGKIVAVELLFKWASLFAHIDRRRGWRSRAPFRPSIERPRRLRDPGERL